MCVFSEGYSRYLALCLGSSVSQGVSIFKNSHKAKTVPGPSLHNLSCACFLLKTEINMNILNRQVYIHSDLKWSSQYQNGLEIPQLTADWSAHSQKGPKGPKVA